MKESAPYSIGDLAEASGIAQDTIRVWERRYGKPKAVRLPSGHRRYTEAHLQWIRSVAEAIARGQRAGAAVRAPPRKLEAMVATPIATPEVPRAEAILEAARSYDDEALLDHLRAGWKRLGPEAFLTDLLDPLLTLVGRSWADGTLELRHEHFIARACESFLLWQRREIAVGAEARTLLLATLSGEEHSLGLLMVALLAARRGMRPLLLGCNTPVEEIVRAAHESAVFAVGVSISLSTGGVKTDREMSRLRGLLPKKIHLLAGGRGARGPRRGARNVHYLEEMSDFLRWADAQTGSPA